MLCNSKKYIKLNIISQIMLCNYSLTTKGAKYKDNLKVDKDE